MRVLIPDLNVIERTAASSGKVFLLHSDGTTEPSKQLQPGQLTVGVIDRNIHGG